jgi:hypothetical protein
VRFDDPSVFVERPADIKRVFDYMLGSYGPARPTRPVMLPLGAVCYELEC